MKKFLNKLKIRYLRKQILSKNYYEGRLDEMHNHIQAWKICWITATTLKGKDYCSEMLKMYLKRYNYYLNK